MFVLLFFSAQTGTSGREIAEMNLSNFKFERGITEDDILRAKLNSNDTIAMPKDSIIEDITQFIHNGGGVTKDDMLAYYYADRGDYGATDSIIAYDEGFYDKENEAKMISVYKSLKQNGRSIYDLISDTTLQQKIMQVVNDSTRAGYAAALSILQEVFGAVYHEPIDDSYDGGDKRMITSHVSDNYNSEAILQCYPNPTKELINFKYTLPNNATQGVIHVYNYLGDLIKSLSINQTIGIETVNLSNLSNGLYCYTLLVNNTTIAKGKFVLNK